MKRLTLPSVLALLALLALPGRAAAEASSCDGLDLLLTLSEVQSGPHLVVERDADSLTVLDPARRQVVLRADCESLVERGPERVRRPVPGRQARTTIVRDEAGAPIYTHSVTSRGARITVIAPGEVNADGLHVVSFDNDDVHVTDGEGRLVFSRRTTSLGALIEREGPAYGCGCERSIDPDGRVEVRSL
ncbi:MAG: hypothetical protein ACQEXJ_03930 [Myxococcota bacterium]